MEYLPKIVKQQINIKDIDNMNLTSNYAVEKLTNPEKWKYEVTSIMDSIKEHGFDPGFLGQTTHGDSFYWCPSAFMTKLMSDGSLTIPHGVHRLMAAKLLGIETVDTYCQKNCSVKSNNIHTLIESLALLAEKSGYTDLYQSWEYENSEFLGRDDSQAIFNGFELPEQTWPGRTVLDIASNTGFFGIQAAIKGAEKVVGFDVLPQLNNLANSFAEAFCVNATFNDMEFWDWDWSQKYDIVFCNQAIYHFSTHHRSKCLGTAEDAFEKICNSAKVLLLMYTFVGSTAPIEGEGYYPTEEELRRDLKAQGFKTIIIERKIPGSKCHVVASRWEAFKPKEK
jgi:SAM-dependent methyltransferase